jgi:hypothetical protein
MCRSNDTLEELQHEMLASMVFVTPEPVIYPLLPPPAVEDPWAWCHNTGGEDEDDDDGDDEDDEIKEESE